jgi:hypothetical protein
MNSFPRVGDLCIETTTYIAAREETLVVLLDRNAAYYENDWDEEDLEGQGREPIWRVGTPFGVGDDCLEGDLKVIAR